MRVAFASPLPPLSSGIADYAAKLLPYLVAAGLELTLFHEGREAPLELPFDLACRPVRELRDLASRFDAVLFQLGNSAPHHAEIYRASLTVPGVVVLHEFMLHHLIRGLTLDARNPEAYVEEMRYAAGESGRRAARRLLDTHHPVDVWRFPLFERVVDRSLVTLVHSRFARRRVLASRPGATVVVVPFPAQISSLAPVDEEARRRARRELGWGDRDFVLASFGFVTPHKRLDPALRAFAELRRTRPGARFVICGEISPHYDLAELVAGIGGAGVEITGRLPLDRFHATMRACDVAVNLRHPTGGETSAALMRLLALGVPTVVTDAGSFAEIPDGAVAKVALDERETAYLTALFARLEADLELRRAIGHAARRHAERRHAPELAAAGYLDALREAATRPREVAPEVPPLAPWNAADPRLALAASLGGDLADLGVEETDREGLAELAGELSDLGWGPGETP